MRVPWHPVKNKLIEIFVSISMSGRGHACLSSTTILILILILIDLRAVSTALYLVQILGATSGSKLENI